MTRPNRAALFLFAMVEIANCLGAETLPKYLGVYASVGDQLTELRAHRQSSMLGIAAFGADVLQSRSGIQLASGKGLTFVVYDKDAAGLGELFLHQLASVELEVTAEGKAPLENMWKVLDTGYRVRLAPVSTNPQMIVRGEPTTEIPPGHWGLMVGGALYDFSVGQNPPRMCVARVVMFAALAEGGPRYEDCKKYASTRLAARSTVPSSPQSSRPPSPNADLAAIAATSSVSGVAETPPTSIRSELALATCRKTVAREGDIVAEETEAGHLRAVRTRYSGSGNPAHYLLDVWVKGTPGGGLQIRMDRGTTRGATPQDLPEIMKALLTCLGVESPKVLLDYEGEKKALSEW